MIMPVATVSSWDGLRQYTAVGWIAWDNVKLNILLVLFEVENSECSKIPKIPLSSTTFRYSYLTFYDFDVSLFFNKEMLTRSLFLSGSSGSGASKEVEMENCSSGMDISYTRSRKNHFFSFLFLLWWLNYADIGRCKSKITRILETKTISCSLPGILFLKEGFWVAQPQRVD